MKQPEYTKEGTEIIRTKDDKVVANIEDGKIVPTAPAYFREEIFAKIEAAANGVSEVSEDQPDADEVADQIEKANQDEEPNLDEEPLTEIEILAGEIEGIHKEGGFPAVVEVMLNREKAIRDEAPKPVGSPDAGKAKVVSYRNAPECDPALGDRTPEFMEWLRANDPAEAIKRYGK